MLKEILFTQIHIPLEEKEEREEPCLRQLCHSLKDQGSLKWTWLSYSGLEAVPSILLWDILIEEEQTISSTGHHEFKEDPQLYHISYLFRSLEEPINSFACWFQISWIRNLIWVKYHGICVPTNQSPTNPITPSVVWNKSKTEHLRFTIPKEPVRLRYADLVVFSIGVTPCPC